MKREHFDAGPEHHVMVDLETVGTKPGSAIATIGAVRFKPDNPPNKALLEHNLSGGSVFYRRITAESSRDVGLVEDPETVRWWAQQSQDAYHEVFEAEPRAHIAEVMREFSQWFGMHGRAIIWSHGLSFDVPILEAVYRQIGEKPPWRYYDQLDTRTLYWKCGIGFRAVTPPVVLHHALYDAAAKAYDMQLCCDILRQTDRKI